MDQRPAWILSQQQPVAKFTGSPGFTPHEHMDIRLIEAEDLLVIWHGSFPDETIVGLPLRFGQLIQNILHSLYHLLRLCLAAIGSGPLFLQISSTYWRPWSVIRFTDLFNRRNATLRTLLLSLFWRLL